MDNGIKPVWVFDGSPPQFKLDELKKRSENREKATEEKKKAEEEGDTERVVQMERRIVKVSKEHADDCKRLLDALGVPWVQAPGEAEAQCAKMAQDGLVYGCATEDMDALTFRTSKLIRNLTQTEIRKIPICEFDLEKTLEGMDLTYEQFVDLCILCGCDYIPSIRGIGPKTAYKLIKEHGTIEVLLQKINDTKFKVPEGFLFEQVRTLFQKPDVLDKKDISLAWKDPNDESVLKFLVDEKGFNKDRVLNGLQRLKASKSKSSQKRLDSYFKLIPSPQKPPVVQTKSKPKTPKKRTKPDDDTTTSGPSKKRAISPTCQDKVVTSSKN
ncbi:hypothetical protein RFI_26615 [Reticulomyxa filosa]|uniref:Flap endonuclease 1 n=1 Tax=Reticulomyxa filosa TaxID=46433 RepID=X6MCJ4_RETFI|nr:hypothetical protein RFI_26615 [Reticulomyxa filosa]|eukprot:ETO10760.1 hypothetical protein RFI_26615 [Reticulomyxa filosa]